MFRGAPRSPCARPVRARRARRPGDLRSGDALGSSLVLETLAKLVHRETHAALHRAERGVRARRDLALRVAAPEREREDLALLRRKKSDYRADALGSKAVDDALIDLRIREKLRCRLDRHSRSSRLPRVRRQSIAAFRQIARSQVRTDPRSERYDRACRQTEWNAS